MNACSRSFPRDHGPTAGFSLTFALDVSHRDSIEGALATGASEVSELNFAEIFAWHECGRPKSVMLDGALCLFITRHGKRCFLPTCGRASPRRPCAACCCGCASREKKDSCTA